MPLAPRAFWYLRHGETDWNAQNLAQGNLEIPLNDKGRAGAAQAAQLFRGRGIATIVSSPLGRARVTAEAVASVLGLPVAFDDELHECSYGVKEGKPMLEPWFQDWVDGTATPEGAESFADLRARAIRVVNRCTGAAAPVLIVAHGGLFRAIRAEMGLEANQRAPNSVPMFCAPGRSPTDAWTLTIVDRPGPLPAAG